MIAIDQDLRVVHGFRYDTNDIPNVWAKPLVEGDGSVCLLNRSSKSQNIEFNEMKNVIIDGLSKRTRNTSETPHSIRDL